jgi:hypothetical protein
MESVIDGDDNILVSNPSSLVFASKELRLNWTFLLREIIEYLEQTK